MEDGLAEATQQPRRSMQLYGVYGAAIYVVGTGVGRRHPRLPTPHARP
jgi:hypothetical protein